MVRRQQAADRVIRPKLRSPGHPKFQRHVEVAFWQQIAKGPLAEEAAGVVGVAQAVGARWFHNAGGMPPFDLKHRPSGRYLSFAEREAKGLLKAQGNGVREIARAIGRDPGTVSRELRRNAATRGGTLEYRPSVAQWKADLAAKRPKPAKLVVNPRLHHYVHERLSGQISRPDGTLITWPKPPKFTGRNKPHRKDRPWSLAWSPEQIANRSGWMDNEWTKDLEASALASAAWRAEPRHDDRCRSPESATEALLHGIEQGLVMRPLMPMSGPSSNLRPWGDLRRRTLMPRHIISTPNAPTSPLYSQGIKAGSQLFVSGTTGIDPSTGALAGKTIQDQTRQALANCEAILQAGGARFDDVVEVGVLLTNPADFAGMNEEYARWFPTDPPTRYAAKLGAEIPGLLVSIRMTAFIA